MRTIGILALGFVLLAACGTNPRDRAITGGGIGAGAGLIGSTLAGGDPGTGLVLGGLAGAAAGVLTDADQIDLGNPFYRRR